MRHQPGLCTRQSSTATGLVSKQPTRGGYCSTCLHSVRPLGASAHAADRAELEVLPAYPADGLAAVERPSGCLVVGVSAVGCLGTTAGGDREPGPP
jgi:hypothetical protein